MASDFGLSFSIGASISSSFSSAFAGASNTLNQLNNQTSQLTAKQARLGGLLSAGMARPHANLSKLHNQYQKIGRAIERNTLSQKKLNASIAKGASLKAGREDLRGQAMEVIGTGTAFSAPFVASAKSAIEFESAMAEVNKTVGFDSPASFKAFSEGIKQLSTELPLSVSELANITATGGQLGVAKENLLGFTKDIAKISVAFDMSATEAGESMGTLSTAMGIPISKISEIGDTVNAVSNNSSAKARDIVSALERVGGVAKLVKLSANDTVALTSSFIAMGKAPEVASTATEAFLRKLKNIDPTNKKQLGVFKQMGLDIRQFKKLMDTDAQQAINLFLSNMNKVSDSQRLGALTNFFGAEHAGSISSLAGNFDLYQKHQKLSNANNKGSMEKEFASISGTTANKLQLFKNNLNLLAINIGDALLPAINDALISVKPLIESFASWAKENPEIIKQMALLVAGLFAGKMAFIGLSYGFNLVQAGLNSILLPIRFVTSKWSLLRGAMALRKSPFTKFAGIFTRFGGALRKVGTVVRWLSMLFRFSPWGIAITALAVGAMLIYKNWDKLKPFFTKLWNGLKSLFKKGVTVLLAVIMKFTPLGLFIRAMKPIMPFFRSAWNKLKAFSKSGIGNIIKTIASFTPLGLFIRAFSAVFNYFSGLPSKFRSYGSNIVQGLIGGITAKYGALKAKASQMASSVSSTFKAKLGIHSPSRVFMGFGANIAEGVAIGIGQQTPTAIKASDDMAKRLAQTEYSNRVIGSQSLSGGGIGTGTIHFSPNINVSVGAEAGDVLSQVQQGLSTSFEQFERMLERVEHNRNRRAFA